MKKCSKCGQKKNLSEFGKDKRTSDGYFCWCKLCAKHYRTKWARQDRKKYPEKYLTRSREYSTKNAKRVKAKGRKSKLKINYDLSVEDWEKMYIDQKGVCAICDGFILSEQMQVDHNHQTRRVRKLLCRRCNTLLGWVEKYPRLVKLCFEYLRKEE